MKSLFVIVAVAVFAAVGQAAERQLWWPQFRGPNGSGIVDGSQPPVEFSRDKNLKWKIPVPSGLSSPIVVGDELIVTAFDSGKLLTIAYLRSSGKELWRAEAPAKQIEAFHKTEGSPAASTPATDGERIVSYFGSCGLLCYDLSGKELWRAELPPADLMGGFGSGVSPIIAEGVVVLVRDQGKDSRIYALDIATGSIRWQRKRQSPLSYCTPVVWDTPGGKQLVAAGHARMIGYDLATGEERWSVAGIPSGCCASPVAVDDVLYFAGTSSGEADGSEMEFPKFDDMLKDLDKDGDGALSREEAEKAFEGFFDNQDSNKDGKVTRDEWDAILKLYSEGKNIAFALRAGGTGDITQSHVLWTKTKGLPYLASTLVYHGQCVMVKDGGIVTAYDAKTGAELYQERTAAAGKYYASPVAANGHIYFTSLDGAVTVLKAGSAQPVVMASNPPLDERTAATPAIADNMIYIRTDKHLFAFAESK